MEPVSLLMLTVDRYELTRDTLARNLHLAGHPYELLVADNGSWDTRIVDWIRSLGPAVHLVNRNNLGVARAFNSLLRLASGPYYCLMGNDIELPEGWLAHFVKAYQAVPRAGLAGIHCVADVKRDPAVFQDPGGDLVTVDLTDTVFGVTFFGQDVFQEVGYFNERFNPYGMEDSDLNYRVNRAGFQSFYLNGMKSVHLGHDTDQDTPYRRAKWASLEKSAAQWGDVTAWYEKTGRHYIPADGEFIIDQPQFPGE